MWKSSYNLLGDILKKIFETIGFISLVCFSFFYTNEITSVIKENDDLLKQITEVANEYEIDSIDAKIIDDSIIPGVSGSSINIDKSYDKMKKIDKFNSNLIVYENIKPNISVLNKYDKYIISGNEKKNEVSLVLLNNEDIAKVLKILDKYDVKADFFVDLNWINNNDKLVKELINNNHIIGSINSSSNDINYINTIVSKINKQKYTFCYNEEKNKEFLNNCKLNTSYTIIPSIKAFDNPLINIKSNIKNGSIISLKINEKTINELPLIIEYIKSKGYDIVTLSKIIEE